MGFAFQSKETKEKGFRGTLYYMSPEMIDEYDGPEIDVWSLGVILYEMLTGHVPFYTKREDPTGAYLYLEIHKMNVDYTRKGLTPEFIILLKRIFTPAEKRITLSEILNE